MALTGDPVKYGNGSVWKEVATFGPFDSEPVLLLLIDNRVSGTGGAYRNIETGIESPSGTKATDSVADDSWGKMPGAMGAEGGAGPA